MTDHVEKITGEKQSATVKEDTYLEEEVAVFCEEGGEFQRQKRSLKEPTGAAEGTGRAGADKR